MKSTSYYYTFDFLSIKPHIKLHIQHLSNFQTFLNKLSKEQRNELNDLAHARAEFMFRKPFLKLKIDEKLAMSILTAMLTTASQKDTLLSDVADVFSFMIGNLVEKYLNEEN